MSAPPVGIGVVGLGGMGQLHARTFSDLGAPVVAGADPVGGQRERFAAATDARTYASHEELLTDDAVDAVVVTTPNRFHEPIAVDALESGRHVLVEKPLAHDLESAERIAAVAAESEAVCMVGFHNRYAGSTAMFEEQLARGRFGDLTHVEANYVRRRGVPGPGSWFTSPDLAGGGALLDIGVHALDLALYALDFPTVVEVSGTTRTVFGDREEYADPDGFAGNWAGGTEPYSVDDSVSAFVRCAGGQTIALEAAWATNREPTTSFVVRGTEAGASFEVGGTSLTVLETGTAGADHYADVEMRADETRTGYREQDRAFLESIAGDADLAAESVAQAVTVQRVIDAIYRSSETGRAQHLLADELERAHPAD